jgi:hypothetical protein
MPITKIDDIEGIGPAYAAKLNGAGVKIVEVLLTMGSTPKGRKDLTAKSGIDETMILKWVNWADLARIKGVGSEMADLLEGSGVDSVVELGTRKPAGQDDRSQRGQTPGAQAACSFPGRGLGQTGQGSAARSQLLELSAFAELCPAGQGG